MKTVSIASITILLLWDTKQLVVVPHVNTACSFQDIFGDNGVTMVLKCNKSCSCNSGI